jgi:hypothetical protein
MNNNINCFPNETFTIGDKCIWNPYYIPKSEGIVIGCSQNHEWLLPWWWMHFRLYNNHPVAFINFGDMSETGLRWCQSKGYTCTLDLPPGFVKDKEEVNESLGEIWEKIDKKVWLLRKSWFKKPFALLASPFENSIWLDLDCQMRGSIQPLFKFCQYQAGIAMTEENFGIRKKNLNRGLLSQGEMEYNGGVIPFKRGSPIVLKWAESAITSNQLFIGDQQLLSHVIFDEKAQIANVPKLYNWRLDQGNNKDAVIIHWVGKYKEGIKAQIEQLTQDSFLDLSLTPK